MNDVWMSRKIRAPPPWLMNVLQFTIAIAITATTIYYTVMWNTWNNNTWYTYLVGLPEWEAAAASWVVDQPMNATITKPAYERFVIHMSNLYRSLDYARDNWIVWMFLSFLPLLVKSFFSCCFPIHYVNLILYFY